MELGIKGWCRNTKDGTVKGVIQGEGGPMNEMLYNLRHVLEKLNKSQCFYRKYWLQNKGSPTSRIEKAVFGEMIKIEDYTYNNFAVKG